MNQSCFRKTGAVHWAICIIAFLTLSFAGRALDLDSGHDAIGLAKAFKGLTADGISGGWVRLRGVDLSKGPETRAALAELHEHGLKACVLLRWPASGKRVYLPRDLREAYENGRKLSAAYGDLVDAWEIDNEPDLGFVPEAAESYSAFLKAYYFGLKTHSTGHGTKGKEALVIMGALGLPPGPWLERFTANDGLSHTDGFNYHYYGYAEDFSSVYRQFEAVVTELRGQNLQHGPDNPVPTVKKDLPVFLTEIGYGMLGKEARDTKEGRLRQWRWFKSVGGQASNLRVEAPLAFYLQPYLEYDTSEFGLTQRSGAGSSELGAMKPQADGIEYVPADFGVRAGEAWVQMIGKGVGENKITPALAQWMALRAESKAQGIESRSWTISMSAPSPVVIDFLAVEGLSFVKRYNGSFVTGKSPELGSTSTEASARQSKEPAPNKPTASSQQPATGPSRSEEFMVHVRTANGNLYEVYPTRQATPEWQSYSEAQGNFTLSFYGRAELPWRLQDNQPASLVLVMYPKQLPAAYEFRRVQLVRIGENQKLESRDLNPESFRYGLGKVILYNFSDKPVSGRLALPAGVGRVVPNAPGADELMVLLPGERREIPVTIKVLWERFERIEAPVAFEPEDREIPTARFMTAFMPDIGGMKATVVAQLLRKTEDGEQRADDGNKISGLSNHELVATRVRATEEAPMTEQSLTAPQVSGLKSQVSVFAQQGATVERTADGFTVIVTGTPPGKQQRVEVEFPWPDGQVFPSNTFLALEYRLRP